MEREARTATWWYWVGGLLIVFPPLTVASIAYVRDVAHMHTARVLLEQRGVSVDDWPNLAEAFLGTEYSDVVELTFPANVDFDSVSDLVLAFPSLASLGLRGNPIDDMSCEAIAQLDELESLDISGTAVTDVGFQRLQSISSLLSVDARGTKVTRNAAAALKRALPHCEVLVD